MDRVRQNMQIFLKGQCDLLAVLPSSPVKLVCILGSLSKHDVNGSENVI